MSAAGKVDFIIVGQGLAGSALALELMQRGRKVIVIDQPDHNRASLIAAGLFNPVTGKMMTRTWKVDELFPALTSFYTQAEHTTAHRFFYPMPLYRPFISIEEQNEWMGLSAKPGMQDYIDQVYTNASFSDEIHHPFGGLLLKSCGYVDTPAFLSAVRELLSGKSAFRNAAFDETQLQQEHDKIIYQDIEAQKIIYANGLGAMQSRFFATVPLRALKGETLLIRLEDRPKCIYNRGVYVVPTGEKDVYKVGATYGTRDFYASVSEAGRKELEDKLHDLLKMPYRIIGQDWGFRPTTPDRRPILGAHPDHPGMVMFNGLGTKGVSLAPYFARQLASWLVGEGEIETNVKLSRFY